ncbi:HK97 family phage prohead protease [Aurantimonas sp. Leaf443]|uniref:HK97 family phage prohead protease n=1 Tax=Aurantimonas sp. Leaf443 TaxID=1736378 RepID=UPI0006FB55F2|nr:HK97 family phage prohead protease [Aurantimonas sp. Leaf443]KQT88232.1 hypothetical protein ASG48_02000 [Aurantimonas sp. Leaf443]
MSGIPGNADAARVQGYAALFERTDLSGDVIEAGAFRASLLARGAGGVRMLWQHDPARPIGIWTRIREDVRGLAVEGRLAMETQGGREAAALVAAGALDGLSIGFRPKVSRRGAGRAGRRLLSVDLWEISLVTFPMQEGARMVLPAPPLGPPVLDDPSLLALQLRAAARRIAAPVH